MTFNFLDGAMGRMRETLFFLALTCGLGGLQGIFCIIFAMGSPYLLSLGFSKTLLALIWLAGPIMGAVVQPYLGLCSDNCQLRWGKRRPYILGGALGLVGSLLALAWTRDIVYGIASIFTGNIKEHTLEPIVLTTATLFLWSLIFFVQPIQAGLRALIVDTCTTEQMSGANAWASRLIGLGSILGYSLGFTDVSSWLPAADNAQMKVLCLWTSCVLLVTVAVCCLCIKEVDPALTEQNGTKSSPVEKIMEIYRSMFRLSPQVKAVCKVQLCSWFGWYCFLFFSTTYIGELYLQHEHISSDDTETTDLEAFRETADHLGSLGFLIYSITNMVATVIAPLLIEYGSQILSGTFKLKSESFLMRQFSTPLSSLRAAWLFSELLFALCMFSTFFVRSASGATALLGVIGISAALSQQVAPFTIISIILARNKQAADPESGDDESLAKDSEYENRPGIVVGLHNVAIAAPQLLASLASSLIFRISNGAAQAADEATLTVGDAGGTAWVMRIGGLASLLAVYMTTRFDAEIDTEKHVRLPSEDGDALDGQEKGRLSDEEANGLLKDYDSSPGFEMEHATHLY